MYNSMCVLMIVGGLLLLISYLLIYKDIVDKSNRIKQNNDSLNDYKVEVQKNEWLFVISLSIGMPSIFIIIGGMLMFLVK